MENIDLTNSKANVYEPKDKELYIFGHRHPDTDSICTSLAYASFGFDAYLIDTVRLYNNSVKTTLRNPPKYYVLDNGLITAISLSKTPDRGLLFENFV